MKNHNFINPIGVTLKHVSLAVAAVAGLGVTRTHAAIGVGTTGSAVQTFDAAPSVASGWSTKTAWTGAPADVTDATSMDAAVALLASTDVANALTSSGTYPPGTNALARFNSNRQGLQTNPTTVVKGCLLMATLQNTSGAAINQQEIAYDFAKPSSGTEELAGLRCYYSMTGLAGSWTVIPNLCTATPGTPSALVNLTATPWADATNLYVLWADDSSTAAGDSYIIDNVIFGRGADIKTFGLPSTLATVTGTRFANYVNTDITWYVPAATDVTTLAPTITLSGGASVVPATGVPQDFTNPVQYVVTAGDPLITKTYTVTAVVGPVPVPISNVTTPAEVNNPAAGVKIDLAVGTGTSAILVGTTQTHWQVGVSKNVIMNDNPFNNLFGSNQRTFSGAISGTGVLNIASTGLGSGTTYSGSVGNTYDAPTTLSQVATLKKTSGDALRGTITMNNAASKMIWGASDQLNDATDLSLTVSGANLDISGKQDTINELRLVTGTFVQTGAGGILKVSKLFINGEQQPEVAYVAGDGFVLGTGYIEVGASGPPVILTPPAVPATPNPADLATTAHPANLPKLDWADSSFATSYDVYLWLSTDPKPVTPNANVALSEFPVSPQVLSLSTYKWQVVAKNLQGDTAGPEWTFSTVDRTLVPGNFSSGYSDATHNLNYIVGVGNSAILQGNFRVHWSGAPGSFSVPVDTNGFILDADTGGGNGGHVASGPISGTGSFVITHGPAGGAWDNPYTISGATPNTYTGPTLLKRGTILMAKTAGVDALPPGTVPITLGMAGDTARLVWAASNQINDAAAITVLLPTVTVAAPDANLNFLNLAGFSDTISALTLPDDGTKTQIRTGTGGVLTVTTLTVNGIVMGSGTYTEANSTFVKGTGSVVVPGAGTTYDSWKVAHAGGQTAGEDFDNDGVSNGVEYFMNAPDGFTANPGVVAGKVTWPHVNPVASFVVQVSDNLTNWVPADPADIDTTTDPTKVVYTLPTGAAKKFCRLFVIP